jgi:hypothetical protein
MQGMVMALMALLQVVKGGEVPTFKIDLSDPIETQYKEMFTFHKEKLVEMTSIFIKMFTPE